MKIWIARDLARFNDPDFNLWNYLERHPEKEYSFGDLHLFYDKPTFEQGEGMWRCGRIASDIPSYMFPNIHCGECMTFSALDDVPEWAHYEGALFDEKCEVNQL